MSLKCKNKCICAWGVCQVIPDANLEGFLPRMNKLVAFEFRAFNKGFATFCADVHAGSVGVEVLPHGRVIPEHLCAALENKESPVTLPHYAHFVLLILV